MFATLLAVVIALVLGHLVQEATAALRNHAWLHRWLRWLDTRLTGARLWRGASGIALALLPVLLLVGLLQWLLSGHWLGLPSLLFGIVVLFHAWGPRNLDHGVEAVLDATTGDERRAAAAWLWPPLRRDEARVDAPALVGAVFGCALRRWFAVLLWFLLLGPVGALGYRLVAIVAQDEAATGLPFAMVDAARTLLSALDWPVAQLMTLSLALVGNVDDVVTARKHG